MTRSLFIRACGAVAAITAVTCCSAITRGETLSHTTTSSIRGGVAKASAQGLLGSFGATLPSNDTTGEVSVALIRAFSSDSDTGGYHTGLSTRSIGSEAVRTASGMGFGFATVPFESFLSVAASPNDENVVRTFIVIENEKTATADSAPDRNIGDDLMNRFTQSTVGSTTTSGSATLSVLQVSPASSSLVFTNVRILDTPQITE